MKYVKIVVLFFVLILAVGCNNQKAGILFNKNPITERTVYDYTDILDAGKRIYYLIIMPKKVESRYINIQVIKKDNDQGKLGYNLIWTKTIRLKDEEVNYYTDYLVINQKGLYIMKVFSKDNPREVLTSAEFFVRQ